VFTILTSQMVIRQQKSIIFRGNHSLIIKRWATFPREVSKVTVKT
jgi:hypothetical protein